VDIEGRADLIIRADRNVAAMGLGDFSNGKQPQSDPTIPGSLSFRNPLILVPTVQFNVDTDWKASGRVGALASAMKQRRANGYHGRGARAVGTRCAGL